MLHSTVNSVNFSFWSTIELLGNNCLRNLTPLRTNFLFWLSFHQYMYKHQFGYGVYSLILLPNNYHTQREICTMYDFCQPYSWKSNIYIGILLPKLFWPTVRKNCSSDREKLLKFEAEGREFAKILRSLEQFIQTVKGQNNFW